jgi:hypothetical protein
MLSKMGKWANDTKWRRDYAKPEAAKYWKSVDQVIFAALVGAGGGWVNAVVNHASVLVDVLIAIGIVIVAALISPIVMYAFTWLTCGGRDNRIRLSRIEALLGGAPTIPTTPAAPVMSPVPKKLSIKLQPLGAKKREGELLLKRCPDGTRDSVNVPQDLKDDVTRWVESTAAALAEWPEKQVGFGGGIAFDTTWNAPPYVVQNLLIRLDLLGEIIHDLEDEE